MSTEDGKPAAGTMRDLAVATLQYLGRPHILYRRWHTAARSLRPEARALGAAPPSERGN